MRLLVTLLGFINGAYMLFDGYYVLLHNKYFGPPKPGPWSQIFYRFGVDVFKLGPLFIVYGLCWLLFVALWWFKPRLVYFPGIALSVLTLWYLPAGTVISLVILFVLLRNRTSLQVG